MARPKGLVLPVSAGSPWERIPKKRYVILAARINSRALPQIGIRPVEYVRAGGFKCREPEAKAAEADTDSSARKEGRKRGGVTKAEAAQANEQKWKKDNRGP